MGLADALTSRLRRTRPWSTPSRQVSWRQARFCVVDIETTGLDFTKDDIVSVGVAEVRNGRITNNTFYEVVRPAQRLSEESMCIHALTPQDLADAPPIGEVLGGLKEFLTGSVIVAHAAWVERAFLDRALRPLGERVPKDLVDTAALARCTGTAGNAASGREPSLELLSRQLGLPVHTPHHALGDALTTAQILMVLSSRLEHEHGSLRVEDLLRLTRKHGH